MMWFIAWMLLTVDEPLRDGAMNAEEKDYITACLASESHQPFNVQQQVAHCSYIAGCFGR